MLNNKMIAPFHCFSVSRTTVFSYNSRKQTTLLIQHTSSACLSAAASSFLLSSPLDGTTGVDGATTLSDSGVSTLVKKTADVPHGWCCASCFPSPGMEWIFPQPSTLTRPENEWLPCQQQHGREMTSASFLFNLPRTQKSNVETMVQCCHFITQCTGFLWLKLLFP